jgi:hypothetical protein
LVWNVLTDLDAWHPLGGVRAIALQRNDRMAD